MDKMTVRVPVVPIYENEKFVAITRPIFTMNIIDTRMFLVFFLSSWNEKLRRMVLKMLNILEKTATMMFMPIQFSKNLF